MPRYKQRKGARIRRNPDLPCIVRPMRADEEYDAHDVFDEAGIRLSDYERISDVCARSGELLGAASVGRRPDTGERVLSVAVKKGHRKKGIGKALTRAALRRGANEPWNIWVVNPKMAGLLETFGLDADSHGWSPDSPHLVGSPSVRTLLPKKARSARAKPAASAATALPWPTPTPAASARFDDPQDQYAFDHAKRQGKTIRQLAKLHAQLNLPPLFSRSGVYMRAYERAKSGGDP